MRNRILGHRRVRADELKPHPLNWRTHPPEQQQALTAVLDAVGVARSVLAYVAEADRKNGWEKDPLTLIDGHLRRDTLTDEVVTVEVLDVSDDEARALLLSLDPLAALAGTDAQVLADLRAATTLDDPVLTQLWTYLGPADGVPDEPPPAEPEDVPEQWLVVVTCKNEKHQAEVLGRCKREGWKAKPVVS